MANAANPMGIVDYIVLTTMFLITVVIGLYHGLYKGGQTTTSQFLLANRNVVGLPVALTILASFTSPITLLGVPAEVYANGAEYMSGVLQDFIMLPTVMVLYVPVFYGLDITTAYEYLQRRFGYPMRCFGSIMFICQNVLYTAMVTFTPALAIEAVTGFNMEILIFITGIVCTFYTTIGGLSAVIWTDAFMAIIILGTIFVLIITGITATGDLSYIWEVNKMANRTDLFQFPLDLTERFTFPNLFIGSFLTGLSVWGVSQTSVQRFLSSRSLRHARMSVIMQLPLLVGLIVICGLQGVVMYAFYYGENPVDGSIRGPPNTTSPDQITVYFVSEQFGGVPGFQGLYISCLVAGSLSTISSNLNALASVTLIDIIRPYRQWRSRGEGDKQLEESELRDTRMSKIFVAVYGLLGLVLSYLCLSMGTLVSLFNTLFGAVGGPLLGTFSLGMMWTRANTYGVLIGSISGFCLGIVAILGSRFQAGRSHMFGLFKLSFQWYALMTLTTTVIISIIMSEFFRWLDPDSNVRDVDEKLLVTFLSVLEINMYFPALSDKKGSISGEEHDHDSSVVSAYERRPLKTRPAKSSISMQHALLCGFSHRARKKKKTTEGGVDYEMIQSKNRTAEADGGRLMEDDGTRRDIM